MAKKGRNVARKTKTGGKYAASRLPKDPEAMNINPRPETMRFQKGPSVVGGVSFLPGSSEEDTARNLTERENRRIPRSSYKMPKYNDKEVIDVSPDAEAGDQAHVKKFSLGGDVRYNSKRGRTY